MKNCVFERQFFREKYIDEKRNNKVRLKAGRFVEGNLNKNDSVAGSEVYSRLMFTLRLSKV